jgi:hypothetical protein
MSSFFGNNQSPKETLVEKAIESVKEFLEHPGTNATVRPHHLPGWIPSKQIVMEGLITEVVDNPSLKEVRLEAYTTGGMHPYNYNPVTGEVNSYKVYENEKSA